MKPFLPMLLFLGGASLFAAEPLVPELSLEGIRFYWGLVPTGGDLGLNWGGTKLTLGGGYEGFDLGRDVDTGEPLGLSHPVDEVPLFNAQVVLRHTWTFDAAELWLEAGVRGHGNLGVGAPSSGPIVDLEGNTFASGRAGLTLNLVHRNERGVPSGAFLETFVETGPAALAARSTDFFKASLKSSAFVPLWDLDAPAHLFSGVLGFRGNAYWTDGQAVPFFLMEPGEVRGYYRLLDTKFRSVATAELRVFLPSLLESHTIVPVVLAFVEGGWYQGYANAPASAADDSGWLAGTGAGMGVTFYDIVTPMVTIAFPLMDGETDLWWRINLRLRF